MSNIFENAKFGDKFRTRDGRIAIYGFTKDERHILIVEDFSAVFRFDDNGVSNYPNDKIDIIGKWEEPITEEELDKMAEESNPNNPHGDTYEVGQYFGFNDGFKAGATKQREKDVEKFAKYAEKFNKENAEMGIKARIDVNSMERWASEIIYGDPFKGMEMKWESCDPLIQKFERAMKGE